jgi:hypothetical protein
VLPASTLLAELGALLAARLLTELETMLAARLLTELGVLSAAILLLLAFPPPPPQAVNRVAKPKMTTPFIASLARIVMVMSKSSL